MSGTLVAATYRTLPAAASGSAVLSSSSHSVPNA
jgi:hypothetical protein